MGNVKLELWLSQETLGKDFKALSEVKSALEIDIDDGTSVTMLFKNLAQRYRPIEEKIFDTDRDSFYADVMVTLNGRILSYAEIYGRVLQDGDEIAILPMHVGG